MAEGASLKIAPMTENGNNCPMSEQAANRAEKELCGASRGSERVKENRIHQESVCSRDAPRGPLAVALTRRNEIRGRIVPRFRFGAGSNGKQLDWRHGWV